jgi:ABC-2 type transport system permease protein
LAGIASSPSRGRAEITLHRRIVSWSHIYWLFWLRTKLLLRGYTRDWRRIVGGVLLLLIAIPFLGGLALGTFAGYIALPRSEARELLLLVLVGLYIFWCMLPLLEFSVNEGLDVTKLTLYPLTRVERMISLLLATLLDIPTLGIVALFTAILFGWGSPLSTLLIVLPALLIAYVHIIGLSQLVLAAFMGLLRSRRYRDLTIIAFALFGSLCSISQQLIVRQLQFNRFDSNPLASIHLAQYLRFVPPGMAGWAISLASEGAWPSALGWLAMSAILTIPLLWVWMLALERGLAVAESGAGRERRSRQRGQAALSIQNASASAARVADLAPAPHLESAASQAIDATARENDPVITLAADSVLRPASTRKNFLPLPVKAMLIKDLRYFWRDPQMKASMLSSFFILIVIFIGPAFGSRSAPATRPWTVLLSCLAPLFLAMNFSLNTFGLERQALSTLFLFPARPQHILWGKNLALAALAFGEQILTATAFAFITNGWAYYIPAIVVGIAAIAVMLGCGNILSILLPFRAPQFRTGSSAGGSPESGCLRSLMGMFSLGVTLVILSPVIAGVVVPLALRTPLILAVTLPLTLLYGLAIHQGASRFIAPRLVQRMPEILAQTTRE